MTVDLNPQTIIAIVAALTLIGGFAWRLFLQPMRAIDERVSELENRMTSNERMVENVAQTLKDLGVQQHELRDDMKKYYEQQVASNTEMRNHFDRKFENIQNVLLNAEYITRNMQRINIPNGDNNNNK